MSVISTRAKVSSSSAKTDHEETVKVEKVKKKRVGEYTLEEVYEKILEKGAATPSIFARLSMVEDFSNPNPNYCSTVCKVPSGCKSGAAKDSRLARVPPAEKDGVVFVIFEKAKRWRDQVQYERVLQYLATRYLPGIPFNVVYSVRCRPEWEMNSSYTITQGKACGNFLQRDLIAYNPRVVMVSSTNAAKSVGVTKMGLKSHLSRFVFPYENRPDVSVLMTLSPAVTMMIRQTSSGAYWGADFFHLIRQDFIKAAQLHRGEVVPKSPEEEVRRLREADIISITRSIDEVKQATDFLLGLPAGKIISWDTETTGLDPWAPDARFLCHQFGYTYEGVTRAVVIPLWHRDNHAYSADEAWNYVKAVLEAPHISKVGHNGKFDLKYTRVTTGVEVASYKFDTMYAIHSICSGLQGAGTYTLKKAVWDYLPESGLGGYDDLLDFEEEEGVAEEGTD